MTRMLHKPALPLLGLLLYTALSCSVKEDRSSCPCYLQVHFSDPEVTGNALLLGWNDAQAFREEVRTEECRPYWSRPVEKGFLTLSASWGVRASAVEGRRVNVPAGGQSDSLYASLYPVDATGETADVNVTFRKQFATVWLDIRKTAGELQDYRFSVDGNTCGIDLQDLSPLPGAFHFTPAPAEGENLVHFRVPRQADDALALSIRYGEADPAVFRLGEIIRDMGYDWKADSLQDVYVSIDLTQGEVHVEIGDWENGMDLPRLET